MDFIGETARNSTFRGGKYLDINLETVPSAHCMLRRNNACLVRQVEYGRVPCIIVVFFFLAQPPRIHKSYVFDKQAGRLVQGGHESTSHQLPVAIYAEL